MNTPFRLLAALALAVPLSAQNLSPTASLGLRDGLSHGFVTSLLQDREGFLWAGTRHGLSRWDGRRFKNFRSEPDFSNQSIADDHVRSLAETGDFLFVATESGGLSLFSKKTGAFFRVPFGPTSVAQIAVSDDGAMLFFRAEENANEPPTVARVAFPKPFWQKMTEKGQPDWSMASYSARDDLPAEGFCFDPKKAGAWLFDSENLVWLGSDISAAEKIALPPSIQKIDALDLTPDGGLFVQSGEAIWRLDGKNWSLEGFEKNANGQNRAFSMAQRRGALGFFWSKNQANFGRARLTAALEGRSGELWYGTSGAGLVKIDPRAVRFHPFFEGKNISSPPFLLPDGELAFFQFGIESVVFERKGSSVMARLIQKSLEKFSHSRLAPAPGGGAWLLNSTFERAFLAKIESDGHFSSRFELPTASRRAGQVFVSKKNGAVFAALDGQLFRTDGQRLEAFSYQKALPASHEVFSIAEADGGQIALATSMGLVLAEPLADGSFSFKIFDKKDGPDRSLRSQSVSAVLVASDGKGFWVASRGGGLSFLSLETMHFRHFGPRDGLPSSVVFGLLADEKGAIWLSTNLGIARLRPDSMGIRIFDESDGLLTSEGSARAFSRLADGRLAMGTAQGLHVFSPADFEEKASAPAIFLTGLRVRGRAIEPSDSTGILPSSVEFAEKISLEHDQNSLELDFAALDFSTEKTRFRYFLSGAEAEWAHEGTAPTAAYLNLPPGKYEFRLQAADAEGAWSGRVVRLGIDVAPPAWASAWAVLIYLLAAGLAVRWVYFFKLRRRLAEAEAERLRELDGFKSRLYANITHEFRTPLTLLLGPSERLLEKANFSENEAREAFLIVQKSGSRLLNLVNQLLDLARIESNALRLEERRGDAVVFLRRQVAAFESFAVGKGVELAFSSEKTNFEMDFDAERLGQVVSNLLSNALKCTQKGGRIEVFFQILNEKTARIEVRDSGEGIAAADLARVFDRFFRAEKASAQGTGIGLALARELVNLMGGQISAESELGRGAAFFVELPVRRAARLELEKPLVLGPPSLKSSLFSKKSLEKVPLKTTEKGPSELRRKALVVEDNPDLVAFLIEILSERFETVAATDGEMGLEKAFLEAPDLVLTDLMMPKKDGFELCEALKNDPRTSHLPVVLLTAKATVEDRLAGLARGADAYLAKPFHQKELLATMENLLAGRERLRAHFAAFAFSSEAEKGAAEPPAETVFESQFLLKLRAFLTENLSNSQLQVEDICRAMGMGRTNLHQKLVALTGLSIVAFLRQLRLAEAKRLLLNPETNVSETAWACGFDDPKYFSRVFAEEVGEPPKSWAQKVRSKTVVAAV